ncbi:hypothetical protein C8K30_1011036 [Promicromonospora sp. AC04]|uniref:hypothetical protein n=1 Tax=Promicromonospora sp. AC04 TaxID=2135723 RepID=UPI000D39B189|nr:hypothetical protein [Promicromonospora sp. AC04]PUB32510.1 hypothetical protein C8K30_1011036 [Promicromonospora sp. AC04]
MADDSTADAPDAAAERLSEELGLDVATLELHVRFRLDLIRMRRGEAADLGYVLIDRQHHPDAAVVFSTVDAARAALEDHPLVENLAQEDCLDAHVPTSIVHTELTGREIFLP